MVERNFDGITYEHIRREIDDKFNVVHDELSDCYYNKKPYGKYGILDKATFDKLHGLIWHHYTVEFHNFNLALPEKDQIPIAEYDDIKNASGVKIGSNLTEAEAKIAALKIEGIEMEIK